MLPNIFYKYRNLYLCLQYSNEMHNENNNNFSFDFKPILIWNLTQTCFNKFYEIHQICKWHFRITKSSQIYLKNKTFHFIYINI